MVFAILYDRPINNSSYVHHTTSNLDVGDICTPYVISMANIKPFKLVCVFLMLFDWYDGVNLFNGQYSL